MTHQSGLTQLRAGAEQRSGGAASVSRWIVLITLISTVTWRSQAIYGGGVDAVVLAKAALGGIALTMAWASRVSRGSGLPMGTLFVWFVVAFTAVSSMGALANGTFSVSSVLSVRLLLLTATIVLLVKSFPAEQLIKDLAVSCGAVVFVAALSGAPSYVGGGRLSGGVPELHSNELALLCVVPALYLLDLTVKNHARLLHIVGLVSLFGVVWATGSRTSLIALLTGCAIMLLRARRLPPLVAALCAFSVPAMLWLLYATDLVMGFVQRGGPGEGDLMTLNSRLIAWAVALDPSNDWSRWFGNGLSVKQVAVEGQYWDVQPLDSSWVSALVQAGWIGVSIMILWIVVFAVKAFRIRSAFSALATATLATLLFRSVLESGLIDSSPAFMILLMFSLACDPGPRGRTSSDGAESSAQVPQSWQALDPIAPSRRP